MSVTVDKMRGIAISLLVIAVLLAGCTDIDPGSFNNNETDAPSTTNGVAVTGPRCTVDGTLCSVAEVTEFSVPKLMVTVENTGRTPAQLSLNEDRSGGGQVLTSMCPFYGVREFRAEKVRDTSTEDVSGSGTVTLEQGERLELTWFVELQDTDIAEQQPSCLFRFETVFSQPLTTVKQLQVRASEDVPPAAGLTYSTTGRYPVELVVEAEDNVVQEVIGGEQVPVQAKSYVVNRGTGSIESLQHTGGDGEIGVSIPGLVGEQQCTDRRITIQTGGEEGETQQGTAMLCKFVPQQVENAQIYEIRAETTYTYKKTLPPVELGIGDLEARQ